MTNVGLFANPDLWPASLQFTNGIAKPDTSRKLSGRRHINKHKETDKIIREGIPVCYWLFLR